MPTRFLVAATFVIAAFGWVDRAEGQAGRPTRQITVFVTVVSAAPSGELENAASDIRTSLRTNDYDWFRVVLTPDDAEVVIQVTTTSARQLQGRLLIFDIYKGPVTGVVAGRLCLPNCARAMADDLASKVRTTVTLYREVFESRVSAGQSTRVPQTALAIPADSNVPAAAAPATARAADPSAASNSPAAASGSDPAADAKNDDMGVDVALVKVASANLRGTPAATGEIVSKLPQGAMLVLVTRELTDGWYNVVDAQSGVDGWIQKDLVDVRLTSGDRSTPFQSREVDKTSPPIFEARNDTPYTLTLTIGDQKQQIPPGGTARVTTAVGTRRYIASVPNVLPFAGVENFEVGRVYSWRFYIGK